MHLICAKETVNSSDMDLMRALIEGGADVNLLPRDASISALHFACQNGHDELVRILIFEGKAKTNVKYNSMGLPLTVVCKFNHEGVARILALEAHVDVNARDGSGCTALLYVCREGHEGIARMLITEANADVNARATIGWTPLLSACIDNRESIVRMLIEADADINAKESKRWSSLTFTIYRPHEAICRLIVACGAETTVLAHNDQVILSNIVSELWGDSAMHAACHGNDLSALRALVDEPDIDQKINAVVPGRGSWTALHVASFMNRLEAAEILIGKGAGLSLATADNGGLTALHLACSRGHSDMTALLLKAMAAATLTGTLVAALAEAEV